MANAIDIKIAVDDELVKEIRWLMEYKNAADKALSVLVAAEDYDDFDLVRTQGIALRALNIGAQHNSKTGVNEN